MNYTKADTLLQGRSKKSRKLENNTYLQRRDGGAIAVKLHETDVVTFNADGSTVLNSGGWRTVTTKARINNYLDRFQVWSDRGEWGLYRQGVKVADYADGVRIGPRGGITRGAGARALKQRAALKRQIKSYAALCSKSLPLEMPGLGDCFYCQMVTTDGQQLGDASKDTSHLTSHMEEGYVVPSLVWYALKEAGYDPQVQIVHGLVFGDHTPGNMLGWAQEAVRKSVTKYMQHRLRGDV